MREKERARVRIRLYSVYRAEDLLDVRINNVKAFLFAANRLKKRQQRYVSIHFDDFLGERQPFSTILSQT